MPNWGGGRTVTTKTPALFNGGVPSSVTRMIMLLVLGTGALAVGQVNAPVPGTMLAPEGAPGSRLNTSTCGGLCASLAVAVKLSVWPEWMKRSLRVPRTGAVLGMTLLVRGVGPGIKKRVAAPSGKRPSL